MSTANVFETRSQELIREWTARFLGTEPLADAGSPPPAAPPLETRRASRLPHRIWELEPKLLCPVIGTCLAMEEVRKLARKHGVVPADASDYEAHVTVVSHCKARNPVSEAVQQTLDRRHALWLGRFAKARTEAAARDTWRAALDRGEAAGAMWGALTCRAAAQDMWQRVYEDIHMLSHQVGAGVRADLARVAALESEVGQLQGHIRRVAQRSDAELANRAARIRYLEKALADAERRAGESESLRERLRELTSGQRLADLERQLAQAGERAGTLARQAGRTDALEERVAALRLENRKLEESLRLAAEERDALERLLGEAPDCADCGLQAKCPARPEFGGRRLLCVGGRTNLQVQYRSLVERAGGQFMFHDGGREEALSRLPELLGQADAVICPADCVGHPAYYQLKRHCKQAGKPCVMLRGSGLASFADGLNRLATGRLDFGPGPSFPLAAPPTQPS
jgi:hypothetical protein